MIRVLLEHTGEIRSTIEGDPVLVQLNTPSDVARVDGIYPTSNSDYWEFNLHQFISIGEPPSPHFIFDYGIKQWIDTRSTYDLKAQKWAEIKLQRDQLEFGGFNFDGNIYDSDQVSQGRIMGAAAAGVDQTWTLADNTTVSLTASQLQQLYATLQAHIASVHERGRIARQLIFDAETKEQVEEINLQHLRVLFYYQNLGGLMQDHEKNLLLLIAIGAAIGFAKLLVSDEKLTWRLTIGRTILGAATSTIAGAIILQIPDINPLALISLASALGIMGSAFIENWLKTQSMKWGVK